MADNRPRSEEDTQAIMNRRRFLIKSTLAGAVLSGSLSGCKPESTAESEPEPEACLSIILPTATQPKPCLEVESQPADEKPVRPTPKICLSRVPVKPKPPIPTTVPVDTPPPELLRPCLSIRIPPRAPGQTP